MAESKQTVDVSFQENGIAIVCMQNKMNERFIQEFNECLDSIERAPACRGVLTSGVGRVYNIGGDTEWMATLDKETHAAFFNSIYRLLNRLLVFPLPTVAAINGHCYAGGALLAFAHDLRVMNSQKGWLCFNEVFINIRLTPFLIKFLKTKISPGVALHKALVLGQRFTGPEAAEAAMVDKAVAPSLILQESQRLVLACAGKKGYSREQLHNMKMDVYADAVKEFICSKL